MDSIKDDIELYDPVKTSSNVYYSRLMHNNQELSIQINNTDIHLNKSKQKAKIVIDQRTAELIKNISSAVIEITSDKSEHFFGKKINIDDCESIYKEALVKNNLLHCFYDDDTFFYETKNKELNIEDIKDETKGIVLLKCSAVVYTKTSFFIRWEISQLKIKKSPQETKHVNDYIIKDLPEHNVPIQGDPLHKKLEEICLF